MNSKSRKRTASAAQPIRGSSRVPNLLAESEQLMGAGRALLALPLLEEAFELAPDEPEVQRLLAVRAILLEDAAVAVASARHAVRLAPSRADLWMVLGRAHKLAGSLEGAIEGYRRAVNLDPDLAEAHVSLGIAFKTRGQLSDAIACYRRALEINPKLAAAHANLGNALILQLDQSRGSEAAAEDGIADEAQRMAVELDPQNAQARANWAHTLDRSGRSDRAVELLNSALALDPSNEQLCGALVAVLHKLRWFESARDVLKKWIPANPHRSARIVNGLAGSLIHLDQFSEALKWARLAQAEAPDDPDALYNIGCVLIHRLDQHTGLEMYRRAFERVPTYTLAREALVLCMNYVETNPETIVHEHRSFGAAIMRPAPSDAPSLAPCVAKNRLRIAYLSGDLRRHSVGYFLEPLLAAHDHGRVEVWAYHNSQFFDEVSVRLRSHTDHWVPCASMTDDELLRKIRSDRIDVLIDLSGTTADGRPEVLAQRAAPMQVTYLGYPTTTGIPTVDFRVTDGLIDPVGNDANSTESLLRCFRTMFCYRPDSSPALGESPHLRNGYVTFGSFNNLTKVSECTLSLWAAVLKMVPCSRLLLKTKALADAEVQRVVYDRFLELGVPRDRLVLSPWRPDVRSHLEVYQDVDIALDTFPYCGATTTCEALWSGVPVITLRGRTHTSRMGASILCAVGHSEWIADSVEDYVALASTLARQSGALTAFRASAREQMQASALMDGAAFAQDFEDLLFQGWHACCEVHPAGAKPGAAEAAVARGLTLESQRQPEAALDAYRQAVAIAPPNLLGHWGKARVLLHLERIDEATEALQLLVQLDPSAATAWMLLGDMHGFQGRVDASRECFSRALEIEPSDVIQVRRELLLPPVVPHATDLVALRAQHETALERLLAKPPSVADPLLELNAAPINQYFRLSYHGLGNRRLHGLYAKLMLAMCPSLNWTAPHCKDFGTRRPGAPIRIGFISRFFRHHSIGRTSVGLIEQLARPEFHITALFIPPRRDDAMARRIAAGADMVLELPADLAASREAIAALELDILFYQDIGMEPHSYFLAFARLAPVQCISFGHPDTTGIPNMDAWISAAAFEPAGAAAEYSEKLHLVPEVGTLAYYDRPLLRSDESIGRAGFGLPEGVPLLACPQALFKFHPDMDDLLAAVLKRLPGARLLLVRGDVPAYQEQLVARWRARGDGIDAAATFFPPLEHQSFLSLFTVADAVLDTVHFNGMNSSLEALAVGGPVVTLPGSLQRGRHTMAMYRRMGYTDLIASDGADYVDLVVRLAQDLEFRHNASRTILERCAVLFRDAAVVRGFESVLRQLAATVRTERPDILQLGVS